MIDLPSKPAPAGVTFSVIDYGRVISGSLGGKDQRIDRNGNRYVMGCEMPPMNSSRDALRYKSRLLRGKSEGCRIEWPLGDFKPGVPGEPVAASSTAVGTTLPASGFSNKYIVREGQPFSLEIDGQHFMYEVTAEARADDNGQIDLQIYPRLRKQPSAGDRLHFKKPMIEGYVEGDDMQWQMAVDYNVGLSFSIRERE